MKGEQLKHPGKDLTRAAYFHFIFPFIVDAAITYGTVDKPAKIAGIKFPGRALKFLIAITFSGFPAGLAFIRFAVFSGKQKIDLPLHGGWNCAPSLLIAVDSFQ
jgi:hypothetical protein